jgi:hypothetical protein
MPISRSSRLRTSGERPPPPVSTTRLIAWSGDCASQNSRLALISSSTGASAAR